ncbi:unnamed protein product [Penicillium viridicatum]
MNQKQHMLQDRRLALKRIARESEAYEIGTQYHLNVIGELLSEISRLRSGQPVHTDEEDQLPIDGSNAVTGDHQLPQREEAFSTSFVEPKLLELVPTLTGESNFASWSTALKYALDTRDPYPFEILTGYTAQHAPEDRSLPE